MNKSMKKVKCTKCKEEKPETMYVGENKVCVTCIRKGKKEKK